MISPSKYGTLFNNPGRRRRRLRRWFLEQHFLGIILALTLFLLLELVLSFSLPKMPKAKTVPASVVHARIPDHLQSYSAETPTGDIEVFILPPNVPMGDPIDPLTWCRNIATHIATICRGGGAFVFWEGEWHPAEARSVRAAAGLPAR